MYLAIEYAKEQGRKAAEARQAISASTVTTGRITDRTTQDEGTGAEVPVWDHPYVDHPFRLSGAPAAARSTTEDYAQGVEVEYGVRTGSFSADSGDLADDDVIEITAGENAGTFWRIVDASWQDQATARRVRVIATERPEGW